MLLHSDMKTATVKMEYDLEFTVSDLLKAQLTLIIIMLFFQLLSCLHNIMFIACTFGLDKIKSIVHDEINDVQFFLSISESSGSDG